MREPLLHFLLIGAALFAIGMVRGGAPDRARVIEVSPSVRASMQALYHQRFGRDPTDAEVKPLIDQWLRNEVLYREALALGLDKGDETLRERIIQKMNLLVFQQAKPPAPSDAEVKAWFEAHRAQFDEPARVDFIAVLFDGDAGETRARDALAKIAGGTEPDDLRARARVYLHRDQSQIDTVFGKGFLAQVLAAPIESWTVAHGKDGWFVLRVDGVHAAVPAAVDKFYDASLQGWQSDAAHALANKAMGQLASHYVIRGASGLE